MSRRARIAAVGFGVALAAACGRSAPPTSTPIDPGPGLVSISTPVGAPQGPPVGASIPVSGGTLTSVDRGLTVTIPAGALTAPLPLAITQIANTARSAVGGAYRLGPDGATFATPITLTFKAPDSYPPGTSIAGVGVAYQDRGGYWHQVDPIARDATAHTVSVATTHFSDWALTWTLGTASAEGPIKLVQTVGIPFDAYGRATLYYQGEDSAEAQYLLTGTLTVPATIIWNGATCVPDQQTKTLDLNSAELTKGSPPVFRWGVGTHWSLSCTAADGSVTTQLMPALFDTMYINLTSCGGYYEAGQVATPLQMTGSYTKNCGLQGIVNGTWDLRACVAGLSCSTGVDCRLGTTVCTNGVASCLDAGVAPDGTVCGTGAMVCSVGQCVDPNDQAAGFTVTPTTGLTTTEFGGTATFTMVLNEAPTADVTVALSSDDTTEGTVSPSSVTFTPSSWNLAQTVTVTGVDDHVQDGDITYHVVTAPAVSIDPRYGGKDPVDVTVVNIDNDVAGFSVAPTSGLVTTESGGTATVTIALTSQPVADVYIDTSSTDTTEGVAAPVTLLFTAATWNVPQTVTVTGVDDFVVDGPQPYSIVLTGRSADPLYAARAASVSATNVDNDAAGIAVAPTAGLVTTEAGGTAAFTVALMSQPLADVTIPIVSTNPLEGVPDVTQLVFTAVDWNVVQTVTVTGVDDFVADGPIAYGVKVGAPQSADLTYNALGQTTVQLTNQDNDVAGITVSPPSGTTTSEAGTSVTFTVVLTSQPVSDVTIPIASSNTAEGAVSPASLTFTATTWNAPQTVTVTGVDDLVADGPQTYVVSLGPASSADAKYNGITPPALTVTNLDNDVAGVTVGAPSGTTTSESGTSVTFTVVLASQPPAGETVIVPTASSNTNEAVVSPDSLAFTPGNWNVPRTVTVTGVRDYVVDGDQPYTVAIGPASGDAVYAALPSQGIALTNVDVDVAGLAVGTASGATTTTSGTWVTFPVTLTSKPTADVFLSVASSDPTAGAVAPATLLFTSGDWNVPQEVTVTGGTTAAPYVVSVAASSSADPNYAALLPSDLSLQNVASDPGVVVGAPSGTTTTEAGGSVTFTVVLSAPPATGDTVTIPVAVLPSPVATIEAAVSSTLGLPLVFDETNWNVPQTVTVTGRNDGVVDGTQPYAVELGPTQSADPLFDALPALDLPFTSTDVP